MTKEQESATEVKDQHSYRFALRWKLLVAFASAFTLVFAGIAIWIVMYSVDTAQDRLVDQLDSTAVGAASVINADDFEELVSTVPPVIDPSSSSGLGYPDNPLYLASAQSLMNVHKTVAESQPYTFFRDDTNGEIFFATSYGYLADPQFGVQFKVPLDSIASDELTYGLMQRGLTELTNQPAYTDEYGSWISAYAPILNDQGDSVGAIGIDFPLAYVDQVRNDVLRTVIPVLLVVYFLLLGVVLLISIRIVGPLKRLTAATRRMADGEYDFDLYGIVSSSFRDEIYDLAESFQDMARKVAAREKSLSQEVQRLKIEIDHTRREESVREITENDDFAGLAERARVLRERMKE
ncbi:MAG: HAMP domain-containing protein [Candidatus Nanopelagicales bacterium]|nr:HAMP domain-containing protein [Candidatus Nanopelagicales bacterium]